MLTNNIIVRNPSNYVLIRGYSPVADMMLIVLCGILLLILRETFIKKSKSFIIFKVSIALLCAAALSNTCFYYTAVNHDNDLLLHIFKAFYHITLMLVSSLYITYMMMLIKLPKKETHIITSASYAILIIGCTAEIMCPILRYSFYRSEDGEWVRNMIVNPFNVSYILFMIVLLVIMLRYRRRIPEKLLKVLLVTEFICVAIVVTASCYGHTSFTATTALLPILDILYMVHANVYSLKTGALNASSFDEYLSQTTAGSKIYYMCLKFDTDIEFTMPDELGKMFYSFWRKHFKKALLFNPATGFFVLAVDSTNIDNVAQLGLDLVNTDFKKHFNNYHIPYRIVLFEHLDFCTNLRQFYDVFSYFTDSMPVNSYMACDEPDYRTYRNMMYVKSQLRDIYLNGSLDDERVIVYCQPVHNVATGRFDTAEALMRLSLPDTGMVYPDVFIPLAEKYGYIHKLSMIILNKTCREIHRLNDEGYLFSRISVNLSIHELAEEHFIDEFKDIVRRNNVSFESIAVELTESRNDTEYEIVAELVRQFRQLGVCTYLDDFGTGYSNFDRILSLKLDVVKFDRSLLLMTDNDSNSEFILDYFSSAFEKLGYRILYEGVETDAQEAICIAGHADYLQGYKFSKPVPIEDLSKFFTKNS